MSNKNFNKNNGKGKTNTNTSKGFKKKQLASRKFAATFVNFMEGWEEVISNLPAVKEIVDNSIDEAISEIAPEDRTLDQVMQIVRNIAYDHVAQPVQRVNGLWEFTISGKKVMVKTDRYVSFGWQSIIRPSDDKIVYRFTVILYGNEEKMAELADPLLELGWDEVAD